MQDKKEIFIVKYYNVLFYLFFEKEKDEFKKDILLKRIQEGERMVMKDIYGWCQRQKVPVRMKFIYRKDFPVTANLWNLYSYCRFRYEVGRNTMGSSLNG